MKIRAGFVSNSSSSSFMIVQKEDEDLNIIMTIPKKDITFIRTEAEFREYYDWLNDEEFNNRKDYKKAIKLLKQGYVIKKFSAGSEDYDKPYAGLYGCRLTKEMVSKDSFIIDDGEC
ncbi:MAG: hypothetical protein M0R17_02860 [Candidatus Omnitrophica bacterium]|jgi:hypothetical protein|nr:hypothetical protein [Candidatus Omnitrophota bacterium]